MPYSAGYKCLDCGHEFDPRRDYLSDKIEDIKLGMGCRRCGSDNLERSPCVFDSKRSTDGQLVDYFSNSRPYIAYIAPTLAFISVVTSEVPEIMYAFLTNLADESGVVSPPASEQDDRARRIFEVLEYNRVEELCGQISFHEGILVLQCMLGGKFYRDHLSHMLRVMLLAHLIGDMLERGKNELVACALAGLFHDIAYPISKAEETIYEISESLRRCHPSFDIKHGKLTFSIDQDDISKILKVCDEETWGDLADETNHAVLSALAFLNFWKLANLPRDADRLVIGTQVFTVTELVDLFGIVNITAQAIAVHDPDVKKAARYSEEPVSVILILADELQDWGRPVGWDESRWVPIPEIDSLLISKEGIHATLDYKPKKGPPLADTLYSPLFQIPSKQRNLARILLDGSFPELSLSYKLGGDYIVLSNSLILSWAKKTKKNASALFRNPVLKLKTRKRIPDDFKQLSDWLDVLFRRVAKSKINLHLSYHPYTGEYIIHSDPQMPAEIRAYKNKEGKVEWNYSIRKLTKLIEGIPIRPTKVGEISGLFSGFYREYDLFFEKTIHAFELIDESDAVRNLVALLQLLPYIYFQTQAIHGRTYEYNSLEFHLSNLWRSYDRRCQFLDLEKSK